MTLDALITALVTCPDQDAPIEIGGCPAGEFDSYRGYYDQLALGTGLEPKTVGELLAKASEAKGKVFQGYKGGDFQMHGRTPVWFSEYGESSGIAIVGINHDDDVVQLLTADISEYA